MGLGGAWNTEPYGPADIDVAEKAIGAALDAGITAFDHADIYRHGKAESVFGEVLARAPDLRGRILLQSKCGIQLPAGGRAGFYDLRGGGLEDRVEESLDRLRTDHLDVLLLHRPDPLTHPDAVAAAVRRLHEQGLIRHIGVSNMSGAQIAALQARLDLPIVANQLEMSLSRRDWVESGVLVNTTQATANGFPHGTVEHCIDTGVQLQAWGALAQGRYTGNEQTPAERATAELVRRLAREKDTTPETIVLWWLQRHPAAIAPVIGSTNPSRIVACGDAVRRKPILSHEEWYDLWVAARDEPLP
ncbi:aldo/keto reductase [Amycolatopsis suaedae]|uniref:Aldo/keto reductase n=2 Tax=Amycolatopsis suaedae TaxID=2510978 RepID=A0A4Q7J8U5_9PSEU|nr:aldo/keto reductase [Amycolatopsis suaedae]